MSELIISLILIGALTTCTLGNPTAGATKIGQVANVRTEGVMCKTETAIVTGKFGGAEMHVTVPEHLRKEVDHFQNTQEMVKITYHTDLVRLSCSNDTGNTFLDKIEKHHDAGLNEKVDGK